MFSDFQPVSHQQWKDKISQELKERDFSEIISRTDENFDILPFYQKTDTTHINCFLHNKEYFYPQNTWKLFLAMNSNTPIPAAQNLQLIFDDFQGNGGISVNEDLDSLLQNVNVENSDLCFVSGLQAIATIELIKKYNKKHGITIRGNIDNDPIINLFIRGAVASKEDMMRCKNIITDCTENFRGLSIQGQNFPELGANKVQELAFTFAAAIEYCDQLTDLGLSYETIVGNMQFCFGISGNYFLEIAKLRAAKLLWANIASQLNMSQTFPILLHGKTSMYNKSPQDNHTNIIRTTIEAMAAISGGCDGLTIYPYDYPTSSAQGVRIAKNIHHILREEAFFDQCLNAASGAYYIEELTQQFVNSTWKLIQQVEEKGGFSRATDFIRESIAEQRQKKQQDVAQKKVIFVGVNKYQMQDHATVTPSTIASQSTIQKLDNPLLTTEQVKEALEVHGYNTVAQSLCCAHPIEKALAKYTPTVLSEQIDMNFKYEAASVAVHHNSLIILVGPSGSGKSTFVNKNFSESMRVSTDECRRMICGSQLNQRVSDDAFDIFYTIIEKRLKNGYPTVADSTALKRKYRQRLVRIAQKYKFNVIVILFDLPLRTCIQQDKKRKQYAVGEQVIERQYQNLQKTKLQIREEKYDDVIVCNSAQQVRSMHFRFTHPDVEKKDIGPFDIVGSINGCYDELQVLLRKLGYQQNWKSEYYHPERRKLVVLGDICNKGPHNLDTFQLVYTMWKNNCAYYIPGDECEKLYTFLKGDKVIKMNSLRSTQRELENLSRQQLYEFTTQFTELYEKSSPYLILADGNLVVSHGGILGKWIGQINKKIKSFCMYGDSKRSPWYKSYHGKAYIVYGHPHTKMAHWKNRTMNINLDVVCGGQLCALRYPEKNIVTVNANKNYYKTKN